MSSSGDYKGRGFDLSGRRFGRLTALSFAGVSRCWSELWRCRCDCGREILAYKGHLLSGHTKSCGCLRSDNARELNRKRHGYDTALGHKEDGGAE